MVVVSSTHVIFSWPRSSFLPIESLTQEAPLKIDPNFTSSNLSLSNRNQFSASTWGRWCFIFASYVKILPLGQNMFKIVHFECKTGKCVGRNSKYLLIFYLWLQILLEDCSHHREEHLAQLNFFYRSSPSKVTAHQRCILSTFEWGILRSRWTILSGKIGHEVLVATLGLLAVPRGIPSSLSHM